jgi:lipopolysaccharide biosynthesis glycosyltransferase
MRGLDCIFLDDDVEPHPALLIEYATAIREHGLRAGGFVGFSQLPDTVTPLTTGVRMSYLTYFWGVASLEPGGEQAPWGVTANVCSRRTRERFDERFPKTGGGEDIDYLLRVVRATGRPLIKAPRAQITHPWWNDDNPSPWRFYGWACGDSLLMRSDFYPEFAYWSYPNVWELLVIIAVLGLPVCALQDGGAHKLLGTIACLFLAEVMLDMHHLCVNDRLVEPHLRGISRLHCALLACVYKNFCELGHITASVRCGFICRRWDWWCGKSGQHIVSNRAREAWRAAVLIGAATPMFTVPAMYSSIALFTLLVVCICAICTFRWPSVFTYNTSARKFASVQALKSTSSLIYAVPGRPLSVCFVANEAYAAALATCIRSVLDANPVLLSVFVLDTGITDTSWKKVKAVADTRDVSLIQRICAPCPTDAGAACKDWPIWAKLWIDKLLPVTLESVIYLDCDTLVSTSLAPLAALVPMLCQSRCPLAAVRDIGLPCGHKGLQPFGWEDAPYFNSGVMLLDLNRMRSERLGDAVRVWVCNADAKGLIYRDQDVLNLLFHGCWLELDFRWNVQGMGTYGDNRTKCESPDRPKLFEVEEWTAIQREAYVVHFTGEAQPGLSAYLSEYCKTPTKPWAWFCHHPMQQAWFQASYRTPFAGWRPPASEAALEDAISRDRTHFERVRVTRGGDSSA